MKRLAVDAWHELNAKFRTVLLVCLVGLMSWLMVANQPAYAARTNLKETQEQNDSVLKKREQDYEKALKVIDDPRGVQKEYQENLEEFREETDDQGGLIEGAKDLVEKIVPGQ